jgi:ATP/maltotriose-dependent transcriptional regulator MalT
VAITGSRPLTSPASRGRRLSRAANAAYLAGQVERASDLVSRSLPIADQAERARLLGLRGVIDGYAGLLEDAVRTLLEGIAVSEDASLRLQMLLEACGMAMYLADYEQLRRLCDRASGYSPVADTDRFVVTLLAGAAAELDGDYTRAVELTVHATEIAARLDDAHCLIWASAAAGRAGTWGDGLPYANQAVRVARERALVSTLPYALQAQASQLLGLSRFDLGYSAAREGWTLAQHLGLPSMASWTLADLATIDALRGDEAQARAHVAELQAFSTRTASMITAGIARALGMLDLGLGRPSEALDQLLASVGSVRPESNPMVVLGVPDAVEAAQRSQRLQDVTDHFDRFEDWVERFPNRARLALLARSRALMEEFDAERHHAQAVELADALSPFDRARSELVYGEWLRRNRRRVDARRHLRAALDAFEQLAALPCADRARSELRASGETARKRDPSTRDQLTPQELNIAGLAAGGLTNAEIGAQLFLSPRTIDYHLRKVFAKRSVASAIGLQCAQSRRG